MRNRLCFPAHALALALALALVVAGAGAARAETRRLAVLIGSNHGDASHAPLRFAEQDAAKLAAVLGELGGLAPSDVVLLRGPSVAEVRAALDEVTARIAAWHKDQRGQVVLVVYYSGHSDGTVLELAGQGLPFAELRRRVTASAADVRLVILDSCRSGALLALKGGTLGQPFDIRLADDLASTGEALIASSAADEAALESAEIGASFFSHHLISGLRGAADLSGDGLVTLAEAYQYAFVRTLRTTSETTVGPQHPAYDYHLAGHGDLVLTQLQRPSAVLDLPATYDRLLLVATPKEQVLAELGPRSAHRIAVPAGSYGLRAWKGGQAFVARLTVAKGQEARVAATDLVQVQSGAAATKGDADTTTVAAVAIAPTGDLRRPWTAAAEVGVVDGVAKDALLAGLRLGLERTLGHERLAVVVAAATGRAPAMRESHVTALVLPSLWTGNGRAAAGLGLGLGGGVAFETIDGGKAQWSGLAFASPAALFEVRLGRQIAVRASAELPLTLLRRDDRVTVTALGAVWLGLSRAM